MAESYTSYPVPSLNSENMPIVISAVPYRWRKGVYCLLCYTVVVTVALIVMVVAFMVAPC